MTANATTCPGCGAAVNGRFCSACGYPLEGAQCAGCGSALISGAGFCHRCGVPVGASLARSRPVPGARAPVNSVVPWVVGGLAVVAMIVLVAAQSSSSSSDTENATVPLSSAAGMARGLDLSTMSPRERADRLFNRVMSYYERGVTDSVGFFADMGIRAYQMLPSLDADARYDMGRIAEVAGDAALARAQSDTILRESPTHLLGLTLGARAARLAKDDRTARTYDRRLIAAEPAERRKQLPEYERHAADIEEALRTARGQSQ